MLSGLIIPDLDLDFFPIPDPGSMGQKGTGSRIRIRNTVMFRTVNSRSVHSPTAFNQCFGVAVSLRTVDPDLYILASANTQIGVKLMRKF
jgi:hypothetical protein